MKEVKANVERMLAVVREKGLNEALRKEMGAMTGPTCCDFITGRLFEDQVMLDTLAGIPNPSPAIQDTIIYLTGRVDARREDQGACC